MIGNENRGHGPLLRQVEAGANRLAGANSETIIEAANAAFVSRLDFSMDLYGGGKASGRIVQRLLQIEG